MIFSVFTPADLWLFGFSVVGLWLVPAPLGRAAWGLLAAFFALGIFLLVAPLSLHPARNAWTWILLSQASWILLVPDLFARGRAARLLDGVSLRALLAWSAVHFMAVRHIFAALQGDLPPDFALEVAQGNLYSGIGGLLLWTFYRPGKAWFRFAAAAWSGHGLILSLAFSTRLLRAHPGTPFWGHPAPDVHAYFAAWPGSLEALFWIPLLIGLHAAVFYKLVRGSGDVLPARAFVVDGENHA